MNLPHHRQGGFTLLVYGIIAAAVLAALAGAIWGIYHKGYSAGEASVRLEWEQANRAAQAKADAERQGREQEARKASAALQQAESTAADWQQKWKEARRASRNIPLAVCPSEAPQVPPGPAPSEAVATPGGGIGLRLTWSFVMQHDAAWLGESGQPVFNFSGVPPSGSTTASAAPYGLDELLDNHAINAQRCSEDRMNYGALVRLIKKLRAQ